MKKMFAGLLAVCMVVSGMAVFAAEEAVADADMLIEEEIQGDVMPISEVTEETEAVEEATAEETTAEETEVAEEATAEETEAVEEEMVVIDTATMVKNAIVIDGTKVEIAEGMGTLVEKDGVIFVPARAALEAVGYQVSWSDKEQMVMGANQTNGAMFIMQVDNPLLFFLTADGEEGKLTMEAAPYKNEDEWRTYLPLSALAKALGYKVGFDAEAAVVTLSK